MASDYTTGLTSRLRAGTLAQHAVAEQSGVVAAMVSGTVSSAGYALYLRNLFPAYAMLEQLISATPALAAIARLVRPALCRMPAISLDLDILVGSHWRRSMPLLPVARRYATRVEQAGKGDGNLLVAHAYTRYLGDLSGGQILGRLLVQRFGSDFPLRFTEFPTIKAIAPFATALRSAINDWGSRLSDELADLVVREASAAFELNIELSVEVDRLARGMADTPWTAGQTWSLSSPPRFSPVNRGSLSPDE
ncbi:MAG TPA: biliverdin-producing heme oxygenase [Acetobacteraceae bacterium]|nr:biliverdin-producing heme oxygenase [Acetobacteraceae bacterium]